MKLSDKCQICGDRNPPTHRVRSSVLNIVVCMPCAMEARRINRLPSARPERGALRISRLKRPQITIDKVFALR